MSFRHPKYPRALSVRFKNSFKNTLNKLSFQKTERKPWTVLITGGAGHLAEQLVLKLVENMREDMRPQIMASLDFNDIEQIEGARAKKHRLLTMIEKEINFRMASYIQIVLVDLVRPTNRNLTGNGYVTFVEGSFTDENKMRTALVNVDSIFHLAAVGMTGQFANDLTACIEINSLGTSNLINLARAAGVQRFIYTSSIGVIFEGKPLNDALESVDYPKTFYNFYCESKKQAEESVRKLSTLELKTTVLRFNGIYGPGEKRVTDRVAEFMLGGWWIGICKPDGKEAMTQLSSVANCVQGLIKAEKALRAPDARHGQVYNIMDKNPVGTFTFWTPLNSELGFTNWMIPVHVELLRWLCWVCEKYASFRNTDPLVTRLEIDLLTINNTFNLDRARRDLEYEPYPDQMGEIVDYYKAKLSSPHYGQQRTQFFFFRIYFLATAIPLLAFFFYWLINKIIWLWGQFL